MGKGSTARPIPDRKTYESNWDAIFKKKNEDVRTCPVCGEQHQKDTVHKCTLKETK
jgi:hypothetical protein